MPALRNSERQGDTLVIQAYKGRDEPRDYSLEGSHLLNLQALVPMNALCTTARSKGERISARDPVT